MQPQTRVRKMRRPRSRREHLDERDIRADYRDPDVIAAKEAAIRAARRHLHAV